LREVATFQVRALIILRPMFASCHLLDGVAMDALHLESSPSAKVPELGAA